MRIAGRPVLVCVASLGILAACGGGASTTATTLKPLTATNFATVPPVDETTTTTTLVSGTPVPVEIVYTIQDGDSLSVIASQFGVTMDEIVAYNEWADGIAHVLLPGQNIKIPGTAGTTTTSAAAGATTTSTAVPTGGPGGTYTIEAGDSLASIAAEYDTTIGAIVAANGWSGPDELLLPGMEIQLPG